MITEAELQNAILRLQNVLDTVPAKLHAIPEPDFTTKPFPHKWSKQQIMGHLIDSAANNHQRFVRIQYEAVPKIVYDPNNWNALNFYEDADLNSIINLWFYYNRQLLRVINHIPPANLQQQCDVGMNERATLAYLIVDYVDHMEHHLKQVLN